MQVAELLEMAEKRNLTESLLSHRKDDIIFVLLRHHATGGGEVVCRGAIDVRPENYGCLRNPSASFKTGRDDAMIPLQVIRKFSLRPGDFVRGPAHPPTKEQRDKRFTIYDVFSVNGASPSGINRPQLFEIATSIEPSEPAFETDLDTSVPPPPPLLLGQRVLFKEPSKGLATARVIALANRIGATRPKTEIICLLVGARPEELTVARRGVNAKLYATAFDDDPHQQVQSAKVSLDMARRKAEKGENVFVLLDSITDLARACVYTQIADDGDRPAVAEINAIVRVKQFFATGRKLENGGSLTFVAGYPDTGSPTFDERVRRELAINANAVLDF